MIDVEPEVFTEAKAAVTARFPEMTMESVTTHSPSRFPFTELEQTDSYPLRSTRDSADNENHAVVVFEGNVYSNKTNGKKKEAKAVMAVLDEAMCRMGFTRLTMIPFAYDNGSKYRLFARWSAVADKNKTIYRR